jgi:hypothetical protein
MTTMLDMITMAHAAVRTEFDAREIPRRGPFPLTTGANQLRDGEKRAKRENYQVVDQKHLHDNVLVPLDENVSLTSAGLLLARPRP